MADLDAKDRTALDDGDFAVPGKRQLPIPDAEHARLAWDMLDRTEGLSDAEKAEARRRITAKLKALGEPMHDDAKDGASEDKDRADQPDTTRSEDAVDNIFFLPITRIDQDQRIVEGVATSEAVDTFGTVFDYEASKAAFGSWAGNVREMHQPKAVGRKVDVRFDDDKKQIVVRARISKGAEDTWQKILDGTLSGYSIGGNQAVWARSQDAPPRCTKYHLAELSIVDQASNPDGRGLTIYRADAADQPDVLDELESPERAAPLPAPEAVEQATETREGKTISAATRDKLHSMRDAALGAANSAMDACGCDDCVGMRGAQDGDGDGVPDGDDPKDRLSLADVTRAVDAALAPLRREVALLRVAAVTRQEAPDWRRFDPIPGKLDEVLRVVAAAEGRLAKIEAQPLPGGPALRAMADAAGLSAAEKLLGTASQRAAATHADEIAALERLAAANPGDQAIQTAIAARILSVQRGA